MCLKKWEKCISNEDGNCGLYVFDYWDGEIPVFVCDMGADPENCHGPYYGEVVEMIGKCHPHIEDVCKNFFSIDAEAADSSPIAWCEINEHYKTCDGPHYEIPDYDVRVK